MVAQAFRPVFFLKDKCPFCMKVQIFLIEAGLVGTVDRRTFVHDSDEEQAIRDAVSPHLEKVSFPVAEVAPGVFMTDSDAIIARLAADAGIEVASLPTLKLYSEGVLASLIALYKANHALKQAAA